MVEALIKINTELQVKAIVPFEACVHCAALTGEMKLFIDSLIHQGVTVNSGDETQVNCKPRLGRKLNLRHIDITLGDKSATDVVRNWNIREVHCGIKE